MSDQHLGCGAALSLHLDLQGLQGGLQVVHGRTGAQHLGLRLRHLADVILQEFECKRGVWQTFNYVVDVKGENNFYVQVLSVTLSNLKQKIHHNNMDSSDWQTVDYTFCFTGLIWSNFHGVSVTVLCCSCRLSGIYWLNLKTDVCFTLDAFWQLVGQQAFLMQMSYTCREFLTQRCIYWTHK